MSVRRASLIFSYVTLLVVFTAACLPAATPGVTPTSVDQKTAYWSEFGQDISFSYNNSLIPQVETQTVPEVLLNDQMMFAGAHPAFAQFRFPGYQGGMPYELPLLVEDPVPQIMVFRTEDFPGFGDDSPQGFVSQQQALQNLIAANPDLLQCGQPQPPEPALPYLPWINARQGFCAQPKLIEFSGGKGVRYLTYYAQSPAPVLEQKVFYTFQGLTNDAKFYIAAFLPIRTGIFPTEMPPCPKCSEPDYNPIPEWQATLRGQMSQLNARPADQFEPSLSVLDQMIQSLQIKPCGCEG